MTSTEFSAWLKRLGLNQIKAAAALGMTRATVGRYESGETKIPKYVALAAKMLELEHMAKEPST